MPKKTDKPLMAARVTWKNHLFYRKELDKILRSGKKLIKRIKKGSFTAAKNNKGVWSVTGGPKLVLADRIEYKTSTGKTLPQSEASIFTMTSKMNCPSFSLPAGPVSKFGTCPASDPILLKRDGGYRKFAGNLKIKDNPVVEPGMFLCNFCYALKGNYEMWPSVIVTQIVRQVWVEQELKAGTFVDSMSEAIALITYAESAIESKLCDPRYFRIHDSGDMFIEEYLFAWIEIARNFPGIKFWAPTRVWALKDFHKAIKRIRLPRNMSLRPSGLTIASAPPRVPGMSAGTTSAKKGEVPTAWDCEAFLEDEVMCMNAKAPKGEAVGKRGRGCRTCWKHETPVNYKTH